jgi:hypothetical protein
MSPVLSVASTVILSIVIIGIFVESSKSKLLSISIEIVVNSKRRMHLCMQDDQNGQKMMVLTSAEETRLTCFILLQNIFF